MIKVVAAIARDGQAENLVKSLHPGGRAAAVYPGRDLNQLATYLNALIQACKYVVVGLALGTL